MRHNLKQARLEHHMTQQQVANTLGIGLRAYQHIEKGVYIGKIEHWDKLEDLFGIHQRILRQLMSD